MIPQIKVAFNGWQQKITLLKITQTIVNFQNVKVETPISFLGVVQPMSEEDLQLRPLDERSWEHLMIHTKTEIGLTTSDKVTYGTKRYRILGTKNYSVYGYYQYDLVEDYV